MTSYFLSSVGIVAAQSLKDFMMIESSPLFCYFNVRNLSPSSDYSIIGFIVADWHRFVDDVSDSVD